MEIRLKTGARVKSDAQTIFDEVEASKVDGDVSLQTIVDRAKPKSAPLHSEFTWDKGEAANNWWLHEARKVVQSIEVVHVGGQHTRAWEAVTVIVAPEDPDEKPTSHRVFRSINDVLADPEARSDLLVRAINDFHALRKRYAGLQELAQVHAAIDAAIVKTKAA